ncbi:HIT domain-containing protein [Methylicorpusculum sp.]|uniref:HIT family protein n=1 Tax=Methylicorpusculum sp. TaxID=2713644 RepID=UPI002ABA8EA7|nr:HIT domain-containing protein [Methylicorpusculum sp.]MDZ4150073.1 HIT domain-containing protein [Methylicorpusculum sp.]
MKKLYAPWRSPYAKTIDQGKKEDATPDACVFCIQLAENNDKLNLILHRGIHHAIMINKYPYNAGHLLIVSLEHQATLEELSPASRTELIELTNHCVKILKKELNAEGINVGLNLGKSAGAGIPAHLHMHILPRWNGDTNFLPTLTDTKQISFDLRAIYAQLKPAFEALPK